MKTEMRNPRSRSIDDYVDVDIRLNHTDREDNVVEYGEWMPHTIKSTDDRYQDIVDGSLGEVVTEAPIRNVYAKLQEVMAQGMSWTDSKGSKHWMKVNSDTERERILSAATRMNINSTLPKNKSALNYLDVNDQVVMIPKASVQQVAMDIQDFVEDCHDNYQRLVADTSLDIDSGWPT